MSTRNRKTGHFRSIVGSSISVSFYFSASEMMRAINRYSLLPSLPEQVPAAWWILHSVSGRLRRHRGDGSLTPMMIILLFILLLTYFWLVTRIVTVHSVLSNTPRWIQQWTVNQEFLFQFSISLYNDCIKIKCKTSCISHTINIAFIPYF